MIASDPFDEALRDGAYPRPQLVRSEWTDLTGTWEFDFDDSDHGLAEEWHAGNHSMGQKITIPFPPESALSQIGDTAFHPIVWYRRTLHASEIKALNPKTSGHFLLHFGAVDYHADVWLNGNLVASHDGGHVPFTAILPALRDGDVVVVRVVDRPNDVTQPRGKQEWQRERHVIWYDRTTGIWQPVWLEFVPESYISHLEWQPDLKNGYVRAKVELQGVPLLSANVDIAIDFESEELTRTTAPVDGQKAVALLAPPALRNGQDLDRFAWSPEIPNLIDATVTLRDAAGHVLDTVRSYFGFRTVGISNGRFLLNGHPYPLRLVLEQGFWPESHLAAPNHNALRNEVVLIKKLGFNGARIHQKIEDPRFLYWADTLGLLVWEEMPSAYEFSQTSIERLTREWLEVLRRDKSHPSIMTWVVFNESWGVGNIAHRQDQQDFTRALYYLTRAIDPSRLVVSNDGWEHTESDLLTVHDYENNPSILSARYHNRDTIKKALSSRTPNGRLAVVPADSSTTLLDAPILVTEFGGISFNVNAHEGGWGYHAVTEADAYASQLEAVFQALRDSTDLAGWCYTQLTDTQQETNGLLTEDRNPKLPFEQLRRIVTGGAQ